MKNFNISFPTEIWFGKNQIKNLGKLIKNYGSKVLFSYGGGSIKKSGIYDKVVRALEKKKLQFFELSGIQPNPRIEAVRKGIKICKDNNLDFILAVGGGSVIDCSKIIACGFYYDDDPWDFLIGKAKPQKALPLGVILTISATGSQTNGGAVISNTKNQQKLAIINSILKPKFAILDPSYTMTVPAYYTAAGIADTMSHAFEQYFSSVQNTYLQDRLAEVVLKTCVEFGPKALKDPNDYMARAELMWASTLGLNEILGIGKLGGDWATHFIEHELSALYDIAHGIGLAILTPHWMKYVLNDDTIDRFVNLAKNVWGVEESNDKFVMAQEGIKRTQEFFKSLEIPTSLKEVNIGEENLEKMANRFTQIGLVKRLNKEDVLNILKAAL
ncbi:MAG: iron-containing alcohol dehydrogenase [Promethearchaeota archaeon]